MTGDQADMAARIRAVLPGGWFADETPVLDALLAGLGAAWAWLHGLIATARAEARIASADGEFLDLVAGDYFGAWLRRRAGEQDTPFRARILGALLPTAATRAAMIAALVSLTGRTPAVFEPARVDDTGSWGGPGGPVGAAGGAVSGTFAYNAAGGWGSLSMPFGYFVAAYRPAISGIASVAGYGTGGPLEYLDYASLEGEVSDAEIFAAVARTAPVATTAWTSLSD